MRYLLIDGGGAVVNVIVADGDYIAPEGFSIVPSEAGDIGDTLRDGVLLPGVASDTFHTSSVTRRQFMMALYVWNLKDAAEALAATEGGITLVAWQAATDFQIDDPMLINLVTQLGKADQLQEFFDFAATL
jgi:dihydroorotase-like cyclic amidohydrolase